MPLPAALAITSCIAAIHPEILLHDCLGGPDKPVSTACRVFDCDHDTDVDLRDVAAYFSLGYVAPRTKYVGPGGVDDSALGRGDTAGNPYRSLQFAVDQLSDGGNHSVVLAPGVDAEYTALQFDTANDGARIMIRGDGLGAVIGNHTASQAIYLAPGFDTGFLTFKDLAINHVHTGNSWAIRFGNMSTDVNLRLENVELDSSHHAVWFGAAGQNNLTVVDSAIEYSSKGIIASADPGEIVFSGTVVNASGQGGTCIHRAGGRFAGVTIIEGSEFHGSPNDHIVNVSWRIDDLTVRDSAFYHRSPANECIDALCAGKTVIERCEFYDLGGLNVQGGRFLALRNGTGLRFSNNHIEAISSATPYWVTAVVIDCPTATGSIAMVDNTILTGGAGIRISPPGVSGAGGRFEGNTVTVENVGASNWAHAVEIGTSPAFDIVPPHFFGSWSITSNSIRYLGTSAGIGMRVGREVGPQSTIAHNTIVNLTTWSHGLPYGFYALGNHCHYHHNAVYARSAGTFVGLQNSIVEFNTFVSPNQSSKGCLSWTAHDVYQVRNNICRGNIICVLNSNAPDNARVIHIEGDDDNPLNPDDPENLLFDNNYYGFEGTGVQQAHIAAVAENIPTLAMLREAWGEIGMAGNDSVSTSGLPNVLTDPANGDFSLNAVGVTEICPLGYLVGAVDTDLDSNGILDACED